MSGPFDLPPEELAAHQRTVHRALFQYQQDVLLRGPLANRLQNLANWYPLVRTEQDEGNAGQPNFAESQQGQRIN